MLISSDKAYASVKELAAKVPKTFLPSGLVRIIIFFKYILINTFLKLLKLHVANLYMYLLKVQIS